MVIDDDNGFLVEDIYDILGIPLLYSTHIFRSKTGIFQLELASG